MYIWKAIDTFWGVVFVAAAMTWATGKRVWDGLHDERAWE